MVHYENIPAEKLEEGMEIGRTIRDRYGRHLVEAGTVVNAFIIRKLRRMGCREVTIRRGAETTDSGKGRKISPEAARQIARWRKPDPARVHLEARVRNRINDGIQLIYQNDVDQGVLADTAEHITQDLMDAIESNHAVAINMSDLQMSDEYTFTHSVDVAVISMIIARNLQCSPQQIYEIGMAGLLHDLGKVKIPPEILNKPARLTPEEFTIMKKHSEFSYLMIADNRDIGTAVKLGVLQHHEKINGKGYPNGATAEGIHPYAKILSVSDIFDALVTDRPYRCGLPSREAVEILMSMTEEIDMDALKSFLHSMILYPVDSVVRLSNGEDARVVRRNPDMLLRPVVVGLQSGQLYDLGSIHCQNIVIES